MLSRRSFSSAGPIGVPLYARRRVPNVVVMSSEVRPRDGVAVEHFENRLRFPNVAGRVPGPHGQCVRAVGDVQRLEVVTKSAPSSRATAREPSTKNSTRSIRPASSTDAEKRIGPARVFGRSGCFRPRIAMEVTGGANVAVRRPDPDFVEIHGARVGTWTAEPDMAAGGDSPVACVERRRRANLPRTEPVQPFACVATLNPDLQPVALRRQGEVNPDSAEIRCRFVSRRFGSCGRHRRATASLRVRERRTRHSRSPAAH